MKAPGDAAATEASLRRKEAMLCSVSVVALLGMLMLPAIPYLFPGPSAGPWFARTNSPDGRHDAIEELRSVIWDYYSRVWITTAGEQDRSNWHQIAPQIDGTWDVRWLTPTHLVVTAWRGSGVSPEHTVWRGVRIEQRVR